MLIPVPTIQYTPSSTHPPVPTLQYPPSSTHPPVCTLQYPTSSSHPPLPNLQYPPSCMHYAPSSTHHPVPTLQYGSTPPPVPPPCGVLTLQWPVPSPAGSCPGRPAGRRGRGGRGSRPQRGWTTAQSTYTGRAASRGDLRPRAEGRPPGCARRSPPTGANKRLHAEDFRTTSTATLLLVWYCRCYTTQKIIIDKHYLHIMSQRFVHSSAEMFFKALTHHPSWCALLDWNAPRENTHHWKDTE